MTAGFAVGFWRRVRHLDACAASLSSRSQISASQVPLPNLRLTNRRAPVPGKMSLGGTVIWQ
jgi:hypothetical protein